MLRLAIIACTVLVVLLGLSAAAALGADAQADAKGWALPTLSEHWRGSGYYLSLWKILITLVLFFLWIATTDWVSRDVQEFRQLNYLRWNPIVFAPFVVAMLLLWILPSFWIGLPLLTIAYLAPLITYIVVRNKAVMIHERVLTRDHLRHWMAAHLGRVGVKIKAEATDPHESGPPVKVLARGGAAPRDDAAKLGLARQSPGLRDARQALADGLARRATAIVLDYAQQGVSVRHMIDGVWIDSPFMPREQADPALVALKILCGLNPHERVARQEGLFIAEHLGTKFNATLTAQGTPTGERVLMQFEQKTGHFKNLADIGVRDKIIESINKVLDQPKGFAVVSSMPANGLRNTFNVTVRSMDRLMRDFISVEDERNLYESIENVPVQTYNSAAGETPATILTKVIRTEPNVLVVRDLVNGETMAMLCDFVNDDGHFVVGSIRARDSAEALVRVLALGASPPDFAEAATCVLSVRLVRKLCEACREAYAPAPDTLAQLGIPPGRVQAFFRPRSPQPDGRQEICEQCNGIGYFGRTGIFEWLVVGENVRKALAGGAKVEVVRAAARKDGMRTLQEEGLLLVVKGVTSLPELTRVLKQ